MNNCGMGPYGTPSLMKIIKDEKEMHPVMFAVAPLVLVATIGCIAVDRAAVKEEERAELIKNIHHTITLNENENDIQKYEKSLQFTIQEEEKQIGPKSPKH